MKSEGTKVTFRSLFSPKYPDKVIVPSAITRARVPASVGSSPPLQVPRESLDDMTLDRRGKFTPELVEQTAYSYQRQDNEELTSELSKDFSN